MDDEPPVQCWHIEPGTPCDWDVCRQPERLAAAPAAPHGPSRLPDAYIPGEALRRLIAQGYGTMDYWQNGPWRIAGEGA